MGLNSDILKKYSKELSVIYASSLNQYKFKYHTIFSPNFYRIKEKHRRNIDIQININSNINHKLTESDIDIIGVRSQLEHQVQIEETKESGWIFDNFNSMKISFYKTGELDGSYVKIPLGSNAIYNIEKNDKDCSIWSILADLHPFDFDHPSRVSNYRHYSNELNSNCFYLTNGFKCSDVHRFNELNNVS